MQEFENGLTPKKKRRRRKPKPKPGEVKIDDNLARELMGHDRFYRGSKGAMRQKY
jgi:hypothetical protein